MKKLLLLLLFPILGFSQSAQRVGTATLPGGTTGSFAVLTPNASVSVCVYNPQTQCNTPISVYSDAGLTNLIVQPIIASTSGQYSYYTQSGQQVIEKVCSTFNQCQSRAVTIGVFGLTGQATIIPGTNLFLPVYSSSPSPGNHLASSNISVDVGGNNLTIPGLPSGNCVQTSTGGLLITTGAPCAAGSASISGQANGVIPLSTGIAAITAQSHLDDGVTKSGTLSGSEPLNIPTSITSGMPIIDCRHPSFAGGLVANGSTDNGAVMQACWNAIPSSGGTMLIVCGASLATSCRWNNPTPYDAINNPTGMNWTAKTGPTTLLISGILYPGTTFVKPNAITTGLFGYGGTGLTGGAAQFSIPGQMSEIYVRSASNTALTGTIGTAVTAKFVGTVGPSGSAPEVCDHTKNGDTYQDVYANNADLWTCSIASGSITIGTNALTVDAVGGFMVGDKITVAGVTWSGAGSTTITSIVGSQFNLAANASATVNNVAVTTAVANAVSGWRPGAVTTSTPSSMTGIHPGTYLGVAETTTCDLATVTRASNIVTATLPATTGSITSGTNTLTISAGTFSNGANILVYGAGVSINPLPAVVVSGGGTTTLTLNVNAANSASSRQVLETCHIPPGVPNAVAGVTDSTFNGSHTNGQPFGPWQILSADYDANTLSWKQSAAADGSSSGGTITGMFEDTEETISVTSITGSTFTAAAYRPHASTAQYGTVGVASVSNTVSDYIKDIAVFADGPSWYLYNYHSRYERISNLNTSAACSGNMTFTGAEIFDIDYAKFDGITLGAFCAPWSMHFTQGWFNSIGTNGTVTINQSSLIGGIKLDHGAQTIQVGEQTFFEQTPRGAISVDSTHYWAGIQNLITFNHAIIQDNSPGYTTCWLWQLSAIPFNTVISPLVSIYKSNGFTNCAVNDSFVGTLKTDMPMTYGITRQPGVRGTYEDGKWIIADVQGAQPAMGPSLIPPTGTENIDQTGGSWSGGCTVTTGQQFYDGMTTAVSLSGANNNFELFGSKTSVTPAVGDMILAWTWAKASSGQTTTVTGTGSTFQVDNNNSAHFALGNLNFTSAAQDTFVGSLPYEAPLVNDGWHLIVGFAQVTASDGTSGQTIRMYGGCATTKTITYAKPGMSYFPVSTYSLAQVLQYRRMLFHGVTPSNMPASGGNLAMDAAYKLYWGSDANLYRASAGLLQTDGGFTVAAARKGTFICTGGGTITITNANYLATSDVTITMNTAGGTITTPPAMKTVTPMTGFTVLCGATDTSTYNYTIWN